MWYTRGIAGTPVSRVAQGALPEQTLAIPLVQALTSDEAGPLLCPHMKGFAMSAAFKISAEEPTSFRTLQDEEPCMVYTFLDYDNDLDSEVEIHFVWTGKAEDPVQVFSKERGEPKVMFLIEEGDFELMTAQEMLVEFQLVCDKWIATVFNIKHGVSQ